jgi:FtsH-binding integral membrane protein
MTNNQDKTNLYTSSNAFGESDYLMGEGGMCGDRRRFILKVYTILFFQLLLTFGMALLFVLNDTIKSFVQRSSTMLITAIVLSFVFLIILACCGDIARSFPINYIVLTAFTLVEGYMVGVVSSFYETTSVMLAIIITMAVVFALTLFACQTKYDFTGMGPYLLGVLLIFITFGFLSLIFCVSGSCQTLNLAYACIGALIFSVYIVFDTQLIVGGSHKYQFSAEDYVFAALNLYLDIINLFLYILQIFGKRYD